MTAAYVRLHPKRQPREESTEHRSGPSRPVPRFPSATAGPRPIQSTDGLTAQLQGLFVGETGPTVLGGTVTSQEVESHP